MKEETKNQDFFSELENTRPFLKMAFEGFAGSGKTFTSAQVAIGLHRAIESEKPIVWYDTEKALKALKPFFDKNGIKVLTRESRSLSDLVKTIELCEQGTSDILVIDSITHVWETFVESYKNEKKRTFIQFQDWGILKPKWKREFSDKLVQSHLHIIFTGRAGYEYDNIENEDTGKKELVKSGIKMKVENETEYEPDIVVLMDKVKDMKGDKMALKRVAQIIKDRTTMIDGKEYTNPTYKNFEPAIKVLLNGVAKTVNVTESKDTFPIYDDKKTARQILLEKIEAVMVSCFPGQSAAEKKLKVDILDKAFETRSWKEVEIMELKKLEYGLAYLNEFHKRFESENESRKTEGLKFEGKEIIDLMQSVVESTSVEVNPLIN